MPLASGGRLENDPAAMSERHPANPCSLGQLFLSALLAGAIFLAALLSSSPEWHEFLHPDASAMHVCLVTFAAAGQCEASVTSPVLTAPFLLAVFNIQPPAEIFSLPPNRDFSLLEHAPPSLA
ncbi:MAG: hypothetical protein ACR2II_13940 [Chthoniobacterales bacterium]